MNKEVRTFAKRIELMKVRIRTERIIRTWARRMEGRVRTRKVEKPQKI